MDLYLIRMAETDEVTFGRLETVDHEQLCVTLEEPWRDANQDGLGDRNVSRIPAGSFKGFLRESPSRGYLVPELRDVPGRSNIQIHKGNTTDDTLGCIIVGTSIGKINGKPAVLGSAPAFKKLMQRLAQEDEFTLHVSDPEKP